MSRGEIAGRCRAQLPAGFLEESEPVFREPWQAQAFSLAVHLIESGSISWQAWAAALGDEIAGAAETGIAEDGSGYYELWLRALEKLSQDRAEAVKAAVVEFASAKGYEKSAATAGRFHSSTRSMAGRRQGFCYCWRHQGRRQSRAASCP